MSIEIQASEMPFHSKLALDPNAADYKYAVCVYRKSAPMPILSTSEERVSEFLSAYMKIEFVCRGTQEESPSAVFELLFQYPYYHGSPLTILHPDVRIKGSIGGFSQVRIFVEDLYTAIHNAMFTTLMIDCEGDAAYIAQVTSDLAVINSVLTLLQPHRNDKLLLTIAVDSASVAGDLLASMHLTDNI